MSQHYRHYRVASRHKSGTTSFFDNCISEIKNQPLLLLGIILLLFLFLVNCITCHR